jgi:hypothetical protein
VIPDDDFQQAISEIANSAQFLNPATSRCSEALLADTIAVESQVSRIVLALKRLHPKPDAS